MKIVMIVPGSGGTFYCENCLRDAGLVMALRRQGHDVTMVPMYLPFFTDTPGVEADSPVFFGGINVYLREKIPFYRFAPGWLRRALDARWLLKLTARRGESTEAHGMGKMTLSMLQGAEGRHAAELDRLAEWLAREGRPDVIHLSTALLIGLARHLRERTGAPVWCMVQDEDTWLDALDQPYDARCWAAIRDRMGDVKGVLAVSRTYADLFAARSGIPRERLGVVYPGIDVAGLGEADKALPPSPAAPTVGYLSRMTESQGLGTLVDAFILLKDKPEFRDLRLRAMGGITAPDRPFVAGLRRKLASKGLAESVDFLPELDRASRIAFVNSLTVMSVPIPDGAAFGTFLLEAMAAGVPVVQPRRGAFPELIEATGGGVCYEPGAGDTRDLSGRAASPLAAAARKGLRALPAREASVVALAQALESLLTDPQRLAELGQRGRASVLEKFTVDRMAETMIGVFRA
jgi:glycosyltransferase involved in cell wall biosynthesis